MTDTDLLITLLTCVMLMALVGWVSYAKTKGSVDDKDGYFLAGRGLTGTFIAGSMLLTNLSAEQLIGLNGSAYGYNLSSMAWEVTAGFATLIMALVFLPRYLAGAFTTLPEFLSERFDDDVRRATAALFLLGYGLITIPSVLYSGALAVLRLFNVPEMLSIGHSESLLVTILVIGMVGGVYAVFGGLRAVAVSDTLNGAGMLIIGILVPLFGFAALGDGSVLEGIKTLTSTHKEKLNAIGTPSDPTPFATIFTGMIFANLFYWGTNQYVIQRTLGAKNLAEGQKGVILTGFLKLIVPFLMMIPGVIAFHLYGPELATIDLAYPHLVANVMPVYLSGFFLAVLLGAVFSSFNSLLNSAATLFVLDIYAPMKKKVIDDQTLISLAKKASIVIALFSFVAAPMLQYAPQGLWQIIRIFTGFYNIPIIAIVLVGLFARHVPAQAAKIAMVFHLVAYSVYQLFDDVITIHFIHIYAILFVLEVSIMLFIGWRKPKATSWQASNRRAVDLTPWRFALPSAILLLASIAQLYLLFSPLGLAGEMGSGFWIASALLSVLTVVLFYLALTRWNRRYENQLEKIHLGES
ncbi:MAG: solute:sodium symporter family transporter [Pseudomonadota bacterium]